MLVGLRLEAARAPATEEDGEPAEEPLQRLRIACVWRERQSPLVRAAGDTKPCRSGKDTPYA